MADKALAVAVFGNLVKGAFIVGGTGGDGVFMRKTAAGWGAPAFVNLAGASVGAQIGASRTDAVVFFMDQASVDALAGGRLEFGTSMTAVAGPASATAETLSKSTLKGVYVYGRQEGLFAGASANGTTIRFDNEENKAVYGGRRLIRSAADRNPEGPRSPGESFKLRDQAGRQQLDARQAPQPARRVGACGRGSSLVAWRASPWQMSCAADDVQGGLTDAEKRENVIRCAFGGDSARSTRSSRRCATRFRRARPSCCAAAPSPAGAGATARRSTRTGRARATST